MERCALVGARSGRTKQSHLFAADAASTSDWAYESEEAIGKGAPNANAHNASDDYHGQRSYCNGAAHFSASFRVQQHRPRCQSLTLQIYERHATERESSLVRKDQPEETVGRGVKRQSHGVSVSNHADAGCDLLERRAKNGGGFKNERLIFERPGKDDGILSARDAQGRL